MRIFLRIARVEFLDEVLITIPLARDLVKRIVLEARSIAWMLKLFPICMMGWLGMPRWSHRRFSRSRLALEAHSQSGLLVKRVIDVVASLSALILTAPLLIIAAIWIKSDLPGPVIYSSPRVGEKGRVFRCYKLRTMVANADELKEALRHRNEREGPFFKISADPRITAPGSFLRKYSLDELPQLWNVIKGDMSLVGPRPHPWMTMSSTI